MEPSGAIAEGEWSSLSGMFTTEEADFMAQLLGNYQFPNELDGCTSLGNPSTFWPDHESITMNMAGVDEGSNYCSDVGNANSYCFSRASSHSGGNSSVLFPSSSHESYYLSDSHPVLVTTNSSISMDYLIEGDECLNQEMSDGNVENHQSGRSQPELGFPPVKTLQRKRESEMKAPERATEDKLIENPSENSKKRSRGTSDVNVQKNKKNAKPKRKQKTTSTSNNEQEDTNAGLNRQTSSSCCSDDESNASQELNGGETSSLSSKGKTALNLSGKTRASRGSATDPQSLYARKRRERINERLRILQNLVPNGTKVDISTMLEEAVQYVKFLQLQIKLLSSDELWMYAPIAYNGMNIGLDHLKITAPR